MSGWREKLVCGARVRILDAPTGLFEQGQVLEVLRVDDADGWLEYRRVGGEMADLFPDGQCDLAAFGDGSLRWEPVLNA